VPPLTRRPASANRRARVLSLAADLTEDLDAVDLDTIDGEFFWRGCRADLLERAEELTDGQPRPIGAPAPRSNRGHGDDDSLHVIPPGVFDYLREGLRFADDFLTLADEASRLYPGVVWRRLVDGDRVAMRSAEAEVRRSLGRGKSGDEAQLHLRVFSGAWTGIEVEDELRRLADASTRRFVVEPVVAGDDIAVRLAFSFSEAGPDLYEAAAEERPRSPYVEVIAPFPLPPAGVVAREYDALVRGERRWHLRLPGGGSRQEKEVAIRTWAVGLLVALGERFGDAMATVCRSAGLVEVSQTRFNQDRQRLVERVPEATPYVFTLRAVTERDTRADGPAAVGNPTDPTSPLQPVTRDTAAYT